MSLSYDIRTHSAFACFKAKKIDKNQKNKKNKRKHVLKFQCDLLPILQFDQRNERKEYGKWIIDYFFHFPLESLSIAVRKPFSKSFFFFFHFVFCRFETKKVKEKNIDSFYIERKYFLRRIIYVVVDVVMSTEALPHIYWKEREKDRN